MIAFITRIQSNKTKHHGANQHNIFKHFTCDETSTDHWQYWKNPPSEKIEWVEDGIKNREFFFIKNTDATTIGMVRILKEDLLYWGKQKEKSLYIHSLVVKDKYAGQGIGQAILGQIENKAKNNGCKYLRLDADSENPKLCAYYEKQEFDNVGTKELSLSVYNLYQKELK